MFEELDRRLQYGPAMRVERIAEAAFLGAAFFTADARWAWVTFVLTGLQVLSPRLAPFALLTAALSRPKPGHALGDLYFDLSGSRGACAMALLVQAAALALIHTGHVTAGMLLLAMPAASFLLAPTVGFCSGCACYVVGRDALVKLGILGRFQDGSRDVDIGPGPTSHQS